MRRILMASVALTVAGPAWGQRAPGCQPGTTAGTCAAWNDSRIVGAPTPDATGATVSSSPDGAVQVRLGFVPANTYPVEIPTLLPGISGNGATELCGNQASPATAVFCNHVAQAAGGHRFGNGDGLLLALLDPGGIVSGYLTVTPGTLATGNVVMLSVASYNGTLGSLSLAGAAGYGTSLGQNSKAGNYGAAVGYGAQANSFASVTIGYSCSELGNQATEVYCSGSHSTAGDRGWHHQIMHVNTSSATPTRLTYDESGTASAGNNCNFQKNSSGYLTETIIAHNISNYTHSTWLLSLDYDVTNTGSVTLTNLKNDRNVVSVGSAMAAASVGTGNTGATVTVTADSSNYTAGITVAGVAATNISWTADCQMTEAVN